MRRVALAAALSSAMLASTAAAQSKGFYLGGDLGLAVSTSVDMTFTPAATAGSTGRLETDHKPGFSGAVLVGYDFGWLRVEAEASSLSAGIDGGNSDWAHSSGLVAGKQDLGGDVDARNVLLNLIADFGHRGDYAFFVGGGVGKSRVEVSGMALEQGGAVLLDDKDADRRSAWQLFGGVRKSFSDHLEGHVRYRYLEVDDIQLIGIGGRAVEAEMASHSVAVGITYRF